MKKNNSGVTLLVLIIAIIVLLIITSIIVYEGKELIIKSKVQTLETNMLTIQAKAKSYAEEIDAKIWTKAEDKKEEARNNEFLKKGFTITSTGIPSEASNSDCIFYQISEKGLSDMGLSDIKNENYIVSYNKNDFKIIDVIFPNGVKFKGNTYYTLSSIQSKLAE